MARDFDVAGYKVAPDAWRQQRLLHAAAVERALAAWMKREA
jgi:hypothetical protein